MPHPTPLSVQINALARLVKEEKSYYTELQMQEQSVQRLEGVDPSGIADQTERENHGFTLAQEKRALEETKAVFPPLRRKIEESIGNLEAVVDAAGEDTPEVQKAREVLEGARRSVN